MSLLTCSRWASRGNGYASRGHTASGVDGPWIVGENSTSVRNDLAPASARAASPLCLCRVVNAGSSRWCRGKRSEVADSDSVHGSALTTRTDAGRSSNTTNDDLYARAVAGSASGSRRSSSAVGTTLQCRHPLAGVRRTIVGAAARNGRIFPRITSAGVKKSSNGTIGPASCAVACRALAMACSCKPTTSCLFRQTLRSPLTWPTV